MSQPIQQSYRQTEQQQQQQREGGLDAAPAPAADETLRAAPPFIVPGDWDDVEWRAVASKPASLLSEIEKYLFAGGPRPHPWGNAAHQAVLPDGRLAMFPSEGAAKAYLGQSGPDPVATERAAQGALNSLNAGLAAHASANSGEEHGGLLDAAAANGTPPAG